MEKKDNPLVDIHQSTFVHDYYPLALPLSVDGEMMAFMKEAIKKQMNGNAVIYEFFKFYLKRLEEGGETARAMREKLEALVRQAGVNCITLTLGDASKPLDDYESILSSIDWWERFLESFDLFSQVRTEAEIEAVYSEGKISLFFALQDLGCIGNEILRLEALYDRGVRIGQLTYNGANSIGSGCAVPTDGGLTEFGKKAIREMNRLGIAVDLSHCGPVTTLEGIAASGRPPAVTHSSCSAVFSHGRAKTDDALRALADKDGYFGVYAVPFFLTDRENPDFSIFLEHLHHAIDLAGIKRVGIGSDWGLWSPDVPAELLNAIMEAARKMGFGKGMNLNIGTSVGGMKDYTEWYRITAALVEAGFSREEIEGLVGGNFLAYLKRAGL